ncbi:MAG: hypothetical protein K2Y22_06310 [Candidatus Obscuribacterales bacterium]|nr:hypothetical protein [Candidatus Obscuribacterales bacterium]
MKNKNVVRKNIWQEDLERELNEHLEKGYDLRSIKTISKRSRRDGESEQPYYRVVFHRQPIETAQEQPSEEKEPVIAR